MPPFRFQLNFDVNSNRATNLLRLPPEEMQNLPSSFLARVDPARYRYAVIGSNDDAMADMLPPQSLVEIDNQTLVSIKLSKCEIGDTFSPFVVSKCFISNLCEILI